MQLALVHTRYQFLEAIRLPIVIVGNMVFPTVILLLFIVPIEEIRASPIAATTASAQIAVFAVMSTCLFTFGVGVAEDRALPWDSYLRTLPAGPGPRLAGRVLAGMTFALLGLLPVILIAALLTAATVTPVQFVAGLGVLVAGALPFLLGGFAIGYSMPSKAAIAVAQVLLLPLAFGGGLLIPPGSFPGWLDALSTWLPTRGSRDLLVYVVTGEAPRMLALVALAGWIVVTAVLAGWAYQRDEGRRFR
ncbi:MAG: ABC transporter permease [Pseudonocardiaceae bacterium]|nr:ABC transporter permease [Pseudonocardiaceae bacterium]